MCAFFVLICYVKRRRRHENPLNRRANFPLSTLQNNPMYQGGSPETSRRASMRDSRQTDDNLYDQINEEEVYDPSGHTYCEIKDENATGESRQASASACNSIQDEDFEIAPGQALQKEGNDDENEDSITFYAAAAEVNLPTSKNITDKTFLYKTGRETVAYVDSRMENVSVPKRVSGEQACYDMTGCTSVLTSENVATAPGTPENVATTSGTSENVAICDAIEEGRAEYLESCVSTCETTTGGQVGKNI
ncbi:Hypp9191 [Branchiostoma lanceolatum]|uniref:Hypp9191 protein n=1 Tax=Branchiostoma lanceolatum TaxID=7740 RepID=A0A8K0EI78_BRALA|nr:Hypp9191 [Branchiostoma lanceolatum]